MIWLLIVVGLAGVGAYFVFARRDGQPDLGSVSHQWLSEQRFGQDHDRQR